VRHTNKKGFPKREAFFICIVYLDQFNNTFRFDKLHSNLVPKALRGAGSPRSA